jgi:phenylalanyl-tRNA synthetase alpha chain
MLEQLNELLEKALQELSLLSDLEALDGWRVLYLGKKSSLNQLLRNIGQLSPEERPIIGQRGNEVKRALETAYTEREEVLKASAQERALQAERIDVTLPGRPMRVGRLHLSTQSLRDMYAIFGRMGFQVFDGREVETDEYNFELLNMPPGHPARDMWDTFYIAGSNDSLLLRTHTSPGQIHAMRAYYPEPIRVILPGKCYRYEQITARSEFMFHQVEGLAVGENITLADLKGTMYNFAREMFGADRQVRFRASYFPFTEPSVEVDMNCIICNGTGCRMCKQTGWVEIAGAGMVHPVVLANGGYDPSVYSGYAFGMGVERPAILKHNIDDIRYFFSNDLRFLHQF